MPKQLRLPNVCHLRVRFDGQKSQGALTLEVVVALTADIISMAKEMFVGDLWDFKQQFDITGYEVLYDDTRKEQRKRFYISQPCR